MADSNIPNLGAVLLRGMLARAEADRAKAWDERGRLRGGSMGLMLEDGTPVGFGCPRAALARYLGSDPPRDALAWAYNLLMLDYGADSEGLWARDLKIGLAEEASTLQLHQNENGSNEYAVRWDVEGGDYATGREDLALLDAAGKPALFGELKQVSSFNTAYSVLFNLKPKLEHAIQSANYALRALVPVQLWYVCRVKIPYPTSWRWSEPGIYGPLVDGDAGARLEPFFERTGSTRRSKVKGIKPFLIGFEIRWGEDGFALVQPLLADGPIGELIETPINRDRIDRFYSSVVAQRRDGKLHPKRPVAADVDGDMHGRYSVCSYCEWADTCDAHEDDYAAWEAAVLAQGRGGGK